MCPSKFVQAAGLVLAAIACAQQPAFADKELKDAEGRSVLLKDDGTWRYLDDKAGAPDAAASAPAKSPARAELKLLRQVELHTGCRFEFELTNTLPYEIRSLVPFFAVSRANGVVYSTESVGFGPTRPGDKSLRALRFTGITCQDIARLQVLGADRCDMGELNKFSDAKGECLARVRVLPSDGVKFDK